MSGPDLTTPLPGSNAIGSFAIGFGSVGTIPWFNTWDTIISQYANSPRICSILLDFFDVIDQTKNLDAFFDDIKNIDTAVGYGLDVWGRILGVNRVIDIGGGLKFFGFEEGGTDDYTGFNQAPFYSGQKLTSNFIMDDVGFRVLLIAKAFSNICDGSIPSINKLLHLLFGTSGKVYIVDNLDMTMTYKFDYVPTALQLAIISSSGVMPRPVGVQATISHP